MPLSLTRTELLRSANLIDGTWRDAHDGSRFAVTDPARLDTVAHAPDSGAADARAATDAAVRALPAWRATPARDRAAILRAWHAAIVANTDDLAKLMSREQGKPLAEELSYGFEQARIFCREFHAELVAIAGHYKVSEDVPAALLGKPVQVWLEHGELRIAAQDA